MLGSEFFIVGLVRISIIKGFDMHCYCIALQFNNRNDSRHLSALKSVKSFPCISSFNSHFSPMKLV